MNRRIFFGLSGLLGLASPVATQAVASGSRPTPNMLVDVRPVCSPGERYYLWLSQDFDRLLSCAACRLEWPFRQAYPKFVEFTKFPPGLFFGKCPVCKKEVSFLRRERGTGLERRDLINQGELLTAEDPYRDGGMYDGFSVYLWNPSPVFREGIKTGKTDLLDRTPWDVVEACLRNELLRIHPQKLKIEQSA